MKDELVAVWRGVPAADLARGDDGRVRIRYRDGYLRGSKPTPLSVAAPCDDRPQDVTDWIDGLLPDAQGVRSRWKQDYGLPSDSPFTLLSAVGRDCPGGFQFCAAGDLEDFLNRPSGVEPLTEADIGVRLRHMARDRNDWQSSGPTGWQAGRFGFSLAGAQTKTALRYCRSSGWALPYGAEPTTHILKPPLHFHLDDLDIAEHLTMRAAAGLGLTVGGTDCREFDWERSLVAVRYDRFTDPGGAVQRLHQEDLCQALLLPPEMKYQIDGGPGLADIATLLRRVCVDPETAVRRFRDAVIFNWLVAGTDAHAKNYSLLFSEDTGQPDLAPLYDVISYLPYDDSGTLSDASMSMSLGGQYGLHHADFVKAWNAVASDLGLPADETADRARKMASGVSAAMTEAIDNLPRHQRSSAVVPALDKRLRVRAAQCLESLPTLRASSAIPQAPAGGHR